MVNAQFGLGRQENFDDRSRNYPIRTLLAAAGINYGRSYTWACSVVLHQGNEGTCVGCGWTHKLAGRPVVDSSLDYPFARQLYADIVLIDPWPQNDGPDYSFGTDVLSGAKILHQRGKIKEYRWAFGIEDLILAIRFSPAVLGLNWYDSMFDPEANGFLRIAGALAGGHCVIANGVKLVYRAGTTTAQKRSAQWFSFLDIDKSFIRIHNSWGANWGINGEAFISIRDMQRLLSERGEACIAIEKAA